MRRFRGKILPLFVILTLLAPLIPPPPPAHAAAPPPLATEHTPPTRELAGQTRIETAIRISRDGWTTSNYVVIATSMDFPDALAGTPLAFALNSPMLLTPPTRLAPAVATEISRLGATRAVVLGGTGVLSPAVVDGLVRAGIPRKNIERVAGDDRYETARAVAARLQAVAGPAAGVIIANGRTYPDALAVAGYAARSNKPILLTEPNALPLATKQALDSIESTDTLIVGGRGVVSDAVGAKLPGHQRIGGADRYETAAQIAAYAFGTGMLSYSELLVATGEEFPDALAAGTYAAKRSATLILTRSQSLPLATDDFVRGHSSSTARITFLGGIGAVATPVREAIARAATTRIAEGVRIVDPTTASELVTVTAQTLRFDAETPLLADLEQGHILIGEPSAAAPGGYLRRVVSVTDTGGVVSVETTGVVIEELIEDGSLNVAQQITPDDIASYEVLADGVTVEHGGAAMAGALAAGPTAQSAQTNQGELRFGFNRVLVGGATLNGSLSVRPSYHFRMRARNFNLEEARFTTTINQRAALTVEGPPLTKEIEIYRFTGKPVKFLVGKLPVWVTPTFTLFAGVDASGSIALRLGVEQSLTITSGLQYRSGSWSTIADARPSFKLITPTASSNVTVEVYVGARADLRLYDLAGPYGEVKPLVECTFTIGGDPWWRAKRAIDLTAGFVAEVEVGEGRRKWTWQIVEVRRTWRVAEASLGQSSEPYVPPVFDPPVTPPGDDPPFVPPGDDPPGAAGLFPDANLERAVRSALGKPTGAITLADMARLTQLRAEGAGIRDLTGLQRAVNLTDLWLDVNQISDLSPLAGLTNLRHLQLTTNRISDLSPLAGLTNLTELELGRNQVSNLSPLAGLTNLTSLRLWGNQVSDLSPLAGLTNLRHLELSTNRISDLSPLAGLTNLTELFLANNHISDLSPLVANLGLGLDDRVYLHGNPIDLTAGSQAMNDIAMLEGRRVRVFTG